MGMSTEEDDVFVAACQTTAAAPTSKSNQYTQTVDLPSTTYPILDLQIPYGMSPVSFLVHLTQTFRISALEFHDRSVTNDQIAHVAVSATLADTVFIAEAKARGKKAAKTAAANAIISYMNGSASSDPIPIFQQLTEDTTTVHVLRRAFNQCNIRKTFLLSLDVEAFESDQTKITEIGIAVAEPLDIFAYPGNAVIRHFIIKENQELSNGINVPDNKSKFNFGGSELCSLSMALRELFITVVDLRKQGDVFLVGHSVENDLKWVGSNGDQFKGLFTDIIDVAKVDRYNRQAAQVIKLEVILTNEKIEYSSLHNAGNDAYYNAINGEGDELGTFKAGIIDALTDPKVYLLVLVQNCLLSSQTWTYFFPTIVKTLGYNSTISLLLTAPVYIFGFVTSLSNSFIAMKTGKRAILIIWPLTVDIIGNIMVISSHKTAVRYTGMFLMCAGSYSAFNVVQAWIGSTVPRTRTKRAFTYALVNVMGNLSNVYGPYFFPSYAGPQYLHAGIILSSFAFGGCCFAAALAVYLRHLNRNAAAAEVMDGIMRYKFMY